MARPASTLLALALLLAAVLVGGPARASGALPAEALAALQRARVPAEALSVVVQEAGKLGMPAFVGSIRLN